MTPKQQIKESLKKETTNRSETLIEMAVSLSLRQKVKSGSLD